MELHVKNFALAFRYFRHFVNGNAAIKARSITAGPRKNLAYNLVKKQAFMDVGFFILKSHYKFLKIVDLCLILQKFPRQITAGKLAPIGVVMLPEALTFEAKPQHLNGKRDPKLMRVLMFRF